MRSPSSRLAGDSCRRCLPGAWRPFGLPAPELERFCSASPGVEIARGQRARACAPSPARATRSRPSERDSKRRGVDYRPLHTSHAFHSAMMEPALAPFTALLRANRRCRRRKSPTSPTSPARGSRTKQATSPDYYAKHLRHAVKFEAGVRTLAADPATLLLEVGPGNALTSLARLTIGKDGAKRVVSSLGPRQREARRIRNRRSRRRARLWLAGAEIDWQRFHANARRGAFRCRPIRSSGSGIGSIPNRSRPRRRRSQPRPERSTIRCLRQPGRVTIRRWKHRGSRAPGSSSRILARLARR